MSFTVRFDDNNQEIVFGGVMRPKAADELAVVWETIDAAVRRISGTLFLNFRRLNKLNTLAFRELAGMVGQVCRTSPELKVRIIFSSVVGWAAKKFHVLGSLGPNVQVEQYDQQFYPGQGVLEDSGFVPILRTQTKMTWRHERQILARHGLRPGLEIADICCGIGDFAVLLQKEFEPARLLALDHAQGSLAYARNVAAEFGISDIEYVYGDASALLLEDNSFDFVTCRHALQVFDRPDAILDELFRICRPGGRVYITNEKNSHCLGEPRSESIQWTYNEVAKIWADFGMDIECGPKGRRMMSETGFEDIKMESFMVTNLDGDAQDFADVIQAWENVYAGKMSVERGDAPEFQARFRKGFQDHISAARHPKGYAGWPIWVTSGRKPR
jgi:ubiquinone/menaquinone biosynthesis C-methylase UbiE